MKPRCYVCGHFLSCAEISNREAKWHFVPDNDFGGEEEWWTCGVCVSRALNRKPQVGVATEVSEAEPAKVEA